MSLFQKNKSVVQSFFELPTSFCPGVSLKLYTFDERNGVSGHALFATDETHTLAGGGFERNGIKIDMEQRGKDGFHRVDVRIDFGALGANRAIDVAYAVAVRFEQIDGAAEEHFAVGAFIFGGGVGKVIAVSRRLAAPRRASQMA